MAARSPAFPLPAYALSQKRAVWLIVAAGLLAQAAAVIIVARSLVVPYVGVDIAREQGTWRLNRVDGSGTAYRAGMMAGDQVVAVGGSAPEAVAGGLDYIPVYRIQSVEAIGMSDGVRRSATNEESVPTGVARETLSYFAVSVAFWVVGFLAVAKRSRSRSALWLFLMSLSVGLGPVLSLGAPRGWDQMRLWEAVNGILAPWIALRFFTLFPFEKRIKLFTRDFTSLIYLPPALLLAVYALVGREDLAFYAWFRSLIMVNLAVGFLLALVSVVHSHFANSFGRARQQIKIVAGGVTVGILTFVGLAVIPELMGYSTIVTPHIAAIGLSAIPLSIGYAIVRHKLIDIDLALSRLLSYFLALILLAMILLLVNSLVSVSWRLTPSLPILAFLAVLAGVASAPIRARIQRAIEGKAQQGRYDYKGAAAAIVTELSGYTEVEDLAHKLVVAVGDFLVLKGACLILDNSAGEGTVVAATGAYADSASQRKITTWASRLGEDDQFPNKAPSQTGAGLFVPLQRGDRQTGTLVLGSKLSAADFSVDDVYLLFIVQSQATLAIENALLLREARTRAADLEGAYRQLQQYAASLESSKQSLEQAYVDMIRTLVLAIESRNRYTRQHSERVARLARRLGAAMGLPAADLHNLEMAGLIHDIGKLGVPDAVLLKPSALEPNERAEVELHTARGVEIVRFLGFLSNIVPLIESHHEWYSGAGYPRGLRGEEIPFGARIIAVADAYDAMTSERPHRPACSNAEAYRRLREGSGTQWDPTVVEAILRLGKACEES